MREIIGIVILPVKFISYQPLLLFALSFILFTAAFVFTGQKDLATWIYLSLIVIFFIILSKFDSFFFRIIIILTISLGISFFIWQVDISRQTSADHSFDSFLKTNSSIEVVIYSDPKIGHSFTDYPVIQKRKESMSALRTSNPIWGVLLTPSDILFVPQPKFIIRTDRFPRYVIGEVCFVSIANSELMTLSPHYKEYLTRNGISGILKSESLNCTESDDLSPYIKLRSVVYRFKNTVSEIVSKKLLEPYASLLMGMIFGDDRLFSGDFELALRNTGTTHIIAASGFNITVIYISIEMLLSKFLSMRGRYFIISILIFLFAISADLSGSVLRATLMMFLTMLSRLSGRVSHMVETLVISVFMIVFLAPNRITDVGLLLSTGAMLGLIIVMPIISGFVTKVVKNSGKLLEFIEENILATFACTVGTLPISRFFFSSGSFLSVLPNLFLLPMVEIIYFLGVVLVATSLLEIEILSELILLPLSFLLELFVKIIEFFNIYITQLQITSRSMELYLFVSVALIVLGFYRVVKYSRLLLFQIR